LDRGCELSGGEARALVLDARSVRRPFRAQLRNLANVHRSIPLSERPGRAAQENQICGVFTTMGHDGQPKSTLVWVDCDRGCVLVNTTLERQKGRNLGRRR